MANHNFTDEERKKRGFTSETGREAQALSVAKRRANKIEKGIVADGLLEALMEIMPDEGITCLEAGFKKIAQKFASNADLKDADTLAGIFCEKTQKTETKVEVDNIAQRSLEEAIGGLLGKETAE